MATIERIKFTVENPKHFRAVDVNVTVAHKGGLELVEFEKGWGPCGRWVGGLEYVIDLATIRIKQTSFPNDAQDLLKRMETIKNRKSLRVGTGEYIELLHEYDTLAKAHNEFAKIETFIYQLEDVRGRIHAVLSEGT